MKNTKYLVASVWCALMVGVLAVCGTTAFAASSAGMPADSGATSAHSTQLAFSSTAPVLLADDAGCDWEEFDGTGCAGDYICTTGDDTGTCVLPQSYTPPNSGSGGGAGTDGEIGGTCDYNQFGDTGCDTNLTCDSSGTCASSISGASNNSGENGGLCDTTKFSGGCDTGLTCNSSGTCVAGNSSDTGCTKNSDCNTGDVCDLGFNGGTCTDASTDGGTGAACSSSADCGYDLMCSSAQNECVSDTCTAAGQSCGIGETCQSVPVSTSGADNQYQCGGTSSSGGGSTPKTPGGTPGNGKTGAPGAGSGGSTTKTVNGASKTAPGPNGSTNILNSSGQIIGNAPAGSTVSINPATGVATITSPNSSTSSPAGTSGLGVTPGACGAGLGALDSAFTVKICNFNDLILAVVNVLLSILAIIAALFIIIGGFRYVTSNGDEGAAGKGLATVKNAAIGLAIAILAYAIIAVVVNTTASLGSNSSSSTTNTTTTSSTSNPG